MPSTTTRPPAATGTPSATDAGSRSGAIALHYLADLPVQQVAEATGAPVNLVKTRLARGRAALAVLLADSDASEDVRHA